MRVLAVVLVLCLLVLGGCNTTQPTPTQTAPEPQIKLEALTKRIPLNQPFPVAVTVEDAAPDMLVEVSVVGMPGFTPSTKLVTLRTDQQGFAEASFDATVNEPGYLRLSVNANVGEANYSDSLNILYGSPSSSLSIQSSGEGDVVDEEDYLESLPRATEEGYLEWFEEEPVDGVTSEPVPDSPPAVIIEGVQYETLDGGLTEPEYAVEYFLEGTGEGEPGPEDLAEAAGTLDNFLSPQLACSGPLIWTHVTFVHRIDLNGNGYLDTNETAVPVPRGTHVDVLDKNQNSTLLYTGYVGSGGRLDFPLPPCDAAVRNNSDPDPLFKVIGGSNKGLSTHYGLLNYRHEWRTDVYYDQNSYEMRGKVIDVTSTKGANNVGAQRIWYRMNQVYDWVKSIGSSGYNNFPVDIYFPAQDGGGVATTRATVGRIMVVPGHSTRDDILFHEFGHEAYYRRMYGESDYVSKYKSSTKTLQPGVFPSCYGCLGHTYYKSSSRDAAMVEGWADFFEAVTTREIPGITRSYRYIEDPNKYSSYLPLEYGENVEIWVAAFLWDWYDTPDDNGGTDDDNIAVPFDSRGRYENVASRFVNVYPVSYLSSMWRLRILPSLKPEKGEVVLMCGILKKNTLGSIDPETCK